MESQLRDFGTFQWLHPMDSLSDRHLFNKCQQEVNCSKNTRSKLFSTNCGVPKDIWMVKISLGLDPLHSASEKNVHTVLSIKLGQKTTCISNCTRSWSQNKQWKKDGQRLDNTHTPPVLELLYVIKPWITCVWQIFEILLPVWLFKSQLSKFLLPLCIGISRLWYLH